jgi:EPS-associated MarR family transcriptional regulator
MLSDETRYKILRLLEKDPHLSQRGIAEALGVSVGKVNYCLQLLIDKGFVKARNFRNSNNKKAYMYYLTPRGIEDKARVTARFFARKLVEYETLTREIESLRVEVLETHGQAGAPEVPVLAPGKPTHG